MKSLAPSRSRIVWPLSGCGVLPISIMARLDCCSTICAKSADISSACEPCGGGLLGNRVNHSWRITFALGANFRQQKMDQPPQPGLHVHRFQDRLAVRRPGQHGAGNQIDGLFRVRDRVQIMQDLLRRNGRRRRALSGLSGDITGKGKGKPRSMRSSSNSRIFSTSASTVTLSQGGVCNGRTR